MVSEVESRRASPLYKTFFLVEKEIPDQVGNDKLRRNKVTKQSLAALLLAATTAVAQESPFQFNGFVDTYHAVQTQHPHDFTTSRYSMWME